MRSLFSCPLIFCLALAVGCALPSVKRDRAADKVEQAEADVTAAEHAAITHGAGNTLAAAAALAEDPAPTPATQLAADRLRAARVAFETGQAMPDAATALELEAAAAGALGTNDQIRAAALQLFDAYDHQLGERDREIARLLAVVGKREAALEKIDLANAAKADRWEGLMRWIRWLVFGAIAYVAVRLGFTALQIAGTVNPALAAGATVIKATGSTFANAVRDLHEGGDRFLKAVAASTDLDDRARAWITDTFKTQQSAAQDRRTKDIVASLNYPAKTTTSKPIKIN